MKTRKPIEEDALQEAIYELLRDLKAQNICRHTVVEVLSDLFEAEWQNAYLLGMEDKHGDDF